MFEFTESIQAPFDVEIDAYNNNIILAKNAYRSMNISVDEFSQDNDTLSINVLYNNNVEKTISLTIPSQGDDNYVLTNLDIKTIFGNQSIVGTGNIDLYVYTLKLSASFSGGMGYIYIDYQTSDNNNNVEVNSVTKFTTLTKATEGSIISCICSKESADGVTVIGNNIRYENGVWYVYRNDTKYSYSYQGQLSNATITNCSQLKKRTI